MQVDENSFAFILLLSLVAVPIRVEQPKGYLNLRLTTPQGCKLHSRKKAGKFSTNCFQILADRLSLNDSKGPTPPNRLAPFSLVCKAVEANGKPTVKRSDNPNKAMGPVDEVTRYKRVFRLGEQELVEVVV